MSDDAPRTDRDSKRAAVKVECSSTAAFLIGAERTADDPTDGSTGRPNRRRPVHRRVS